MTMPQPDADAAESSRRLAALIAAAGIAIGAAWAGLLANFAAGAFIIVLRPFKVGDYVLAADVYAVADDGQETLCATLLGTARNIDMNPRPR